MNLKHDIVVVGGGPAGMAAAIAAYDSGATDVIILDRESEMGGILRQCIHNGFGIHKLGRELTGPEYAAEYAAMVMERGIRVYTDTTVLGVTPDRVVTATNTEGIMKIEAGAVILAMGCRERPRGALNIPGTRPAGIFSAGTAQKYINCKGYMVGKKVVILGSGDIGLIMARRMSLQGAKVEAVCEIMPYSGGLTRNIVQCLEDYDIPLYLSHTITDIRGENGRVCGVTVAKVDENRRPVPGSEMEFDCDTVLLSVGLIPENELTREAGIRMDPRTNGAIVYENMETSLEGIFACGNVVHVHDLVDFVSAESARAGAAAAAFALTAAKGESQTVTELKNGNGVTYTVPQRIRTERVEKLADVFFRVNRIFKNSRILVTADGKELAGYKREHMAPGEMEHILLPKKILETANGADITVAVEEVAL